MTVYTEKKTEVNQCKMKACGYYRHYLARGPADLTHEGYHAAEDRCLFWQSKADEAGEKYGYTSRAFVMASRIADSWEARVRA